MVVIAEVKKMMQQARRDKRGRILATVWASALTTALLSLAIAVAFSALAYASRGDTNGTDNRAAAIRLAHDGIRGFDLVKLEKAIDSLEPALESNPSLDELLALGQAYIWVGEIRALKEGNKALDTYGWKAVSVGEKALSMAPDSSKAHSLLAHAYEILSRDRGMASLKFVFKIPEHSRAALRLDPNNQEAQIITALARLEAPPPIGNASEGVKRFTELSKRYPDCDLCYLYLGRAYLKAGDRQRAGEAFRRALQVNPANILAKSALAEL